MKKIINVYDSAFSQQISSKHFSSINEAIAEGSQNSTEELELRIYPGRFIGKISVDRPLTIIGKPQNHNKVILNLDIENRNAQDLKIQDVIMDSSNDSRILQEGGILNLHRIKFINTQVYKSSEYSHFNTCINVSLGTKLIAQDLILLANTMPAIRIDGESTKAILNDVIISGNRVPPEAVNNGLEKIGAIEVRGGGTLPIENSFILENDCIGIYVCDNSRMHLRDSVVKNTRGVMGTESNVSYYGVNIMATSESIVELRDFFCSGASVGIRLDGAYLTAKSGYVFNNTIGLSVLYNPNDNYDIRCVSDTVAFIENITNLDTLIIPIPDPIGDNLNFNNLDCPRVHWNEN